MSRAPARGRVEPPAQPFSLPVITALSQLLDGHWDGTHRFGIAINTHARLDDFFNALNIPVAAAPSISKKIRATLNALNSRPPNIPALKSLIEQVVDPRHHFEHHDLAIAHLNRALAPDGMEVRQVGAAFRLLSTSADGIAANALQTHADALDMQSVKADFERAVALAESDPAGSITSACSTVESVCKCILDEMGKPYPAKQEIRPLVAEVAGFLNLSPGRDDLPKEWESDIRMILQGLYTAVAGLGALRTHAGDAHGRGKNPFPVDARIARLAVHAASTVSLFYIETWRRIAPKP